MEQITRLENKAPGPYEFYLFLLGENGLCFGFWPEGDPSGGLDEARERMLALLWRNLPKAPASILILAGSPGLMAHRLSQKGYVAEAISPFESIIGHDKEKYPDIREHLRAEDFSDMDDADFMGKQYDAILFPESLKFFPSPARAFRMAGSLLNPGGVILVGDEVRHYKSTKNRINACLRTDIVTGIFENSMFISRNREIGKEVIKTCDRIIHRISKNFQGIAGALASDNASQGLQALADDFRLKKKGLETDEMGYEIFIIKKSPITVRSYIERDEDVILPAFRRIFSTQRSMEHWYWKFRDNSFGAYKIALAMNDDGRLAAQNAMHPVPFYSAAHSSGGSPVHFPSNFIALQSVDTMTDPAFRGVGRGPTSVLSRVTIYFYNKFCIHQVPFTYGFLSGPHKKFGELFLQYQYTTGIPYHVLDLRKSSLKISFSEKIACIGYSLEKVTGVHEEFDLFFDRVRDDYGLLIRRNAAWLKWRYLDCPDNIHHVFAVRRFGRLMGWSVFSLRENTLVWGDALFDKRGKNAAPFLLDHVTRFFFPDAVRVIGWFSPTPAWWTSIMGRTGFEVTDEPDHLTPAYTIFDPGCSLELFERYRYYTMGDSDLF